MKRKRWQTKSDEEGASAAEAKFLLRAKILIILAFPFGESGFCEQCEQKTREVLPVKNFACSSVLCVVDLYRLGFASLPEPLSPKGKASKIAIFGVF